MCRGCGSLDLQTFGNDFIKTKNELSFSWWYNHENGSFFVEYI